MCVQCNERNNNTNRNKNLSYSVSVVREALRWRAWRWSENSGWRSSRGCCSTGCRSRRSSRLYGHCGRCFGDRRGARRGGLRSGLRFTCCRQWKKCWCCRGRARLRSSLRFTRQWKKRWCCRRRLKKGQTSANTSNIIIAVLALITLLYRRCTS